MIAGVADTHAALWYLLENPLLSITARTFIDDAAAAAGQEILLSPLPDRIVAATAVYFGVPVISGDDRIRASNVPTVW